MEVPVRTPSNSCDSVSGGPGHLLRKSKISGEFLKIFLLPVTWQGHRRLCKWPLEVESNIPSGHLVEMYRDLMCTEFCSGKVEGKGTVTTKQ